MLSAFKRLLLAVKSPYATNVFITKNVNKSVHTESLYEE